MDDHAASQQLVQLAMWAASDRANASRTELPDLQDRDITSVLVEPRIQQIAYEATVQALARALPPSLVSFLR